MEAQKRAQVLDHLAKAAAALDPHAPHLASRIRAIANSLETTVEAQAEYQRARSAGH